VAVGRERWTSEPLAIAASESLDYRIEMPMLAVALPALVVEADRDCRVRPDAGLAAARLWDEAKKALEGVVWTERQGTLRHRIAWYDFKLDPRTLEVEERHFESRDGAYRGSPFATESPTIIDDLGYVRQIQTGEWVFDAPDAKVLLSDAFADQHCFAVAKPDRDLPDLVGLQFEPVRRRDVADIEGVLWLNGGSAELDHLEYRYRRLPGRLKAVESRLIGGRVEFARMPDGPWIVSRWWIRMPEIGLRQVPRGRPDYDTVLLALREQGGIVEEVQNFRGDVVWRAPAASPGEHR
jgi:hypothetical protein